MGYFMMNRPYLKGRILSVCILVLSLFLYPALSVAETATSQKTLYERLGGYDPISAVVDVFLIKVWADPVVGRYFVGMGTDTRNQLRKKTRTSCVPIPVGLAKK